ncbi:MAG TPA: sigma-70 family RNA polymerase sigma factor [Bryobacteraceae bacterium]|nr:sigma-70 family RNA polymerase sigma factor [Bryobacteraceae bacterium]
MADPVQDTNQDQLYQEAATAFSAALERLARAYEADPHRRQDLLQDMHLALWRSFEHFAQRCSLRTWVYRVAHNVATSHLIRRQRIYARLVSLEEVESVAIRQEDQFGVDRRMLRERLLRLIERLKPTDRQVVLSYLEGMDAASIGEITGMSPANVAMKIHRVKNVLARRFQKGGQHAG